MDNQFRLVVKLITVVSELFEGAQEPTNLVATLYSSDGKQRALPSTEDTETTDV